MIIIIGVITLLLVDLLAWSAKHPSWSPSPRAAVLFVRKALKCHG